MRTFQPSYGLVDRYDHDFRQFARRNSGEDAYEFDWYGMGVNGLPVYGENTSYRVVPATKQINDNERTWVPGTPGFDQLSQQAYNDAWWAKKLPFGKTCSDQMLAALKDLMTEGQSVQASVDAGTTEPVPPTDISTGPTTPEEDADVESKHKEEDEEKPFYEQEWFAPIVAVSGLVIISGVSAYFYVKRKKTTESGL